MKERALTYQQNAGKLKRTAGELQTFKDFHKDRMKNTIFMPGLKGREME